jgi:hypothetical protein
VAIELNSVEFPPYESAHLGTGDHSFAETVAQPGSVTDRVMEPLLFQRPMTRMSCLLFELQPGNTVGVTMEPKWYAVAFRSHIPPSAFNAVTVFFHPSPGGAGMKDSEYPTLGGKWRSLYRYAQMLGCQLSAASSNLVLVMPMFSNRTYGTMGVFGGAWEEILEGILHKAQQHRIASAGPGIHKRAKLRHVILAGFSRGRAPMTIFRSRARGLAPLLRGIWDYDGVGATLPAEKSGMRVLAYYQSSGAGKRGYPMPLPRWLLYPWFADMKGFDSVHGRIPATMMTHSASQPEFIFPI